MTTTPGTKPTPALDIEKWYWEATTTKHHEMVEAAHSWVYDEDYPLWLVMLGRPGTGKTHLARRASQIKHIPMIKWTRILQDCKADDYGWFNSACSNRVAIIDDIGADCFLADGSVSNFASQKLCTLLDRRIRKLTMLTSNFSLRDFAEKFDERIASRLVRDSAIVTSFDVDDYCLEQYNASA